MGISLRKPRSDPFAVDFEEFWRAYPRRVGKLAAEKAYAQVRRGGIPHEELMDGITQYVRSKPAYADWCHPTTWLHQGRWMDEPTTGVSAGGLQLDCPHQPCCASRWVCGRRQQLEWSVSRER